MMESDRFRFLAPDKINHSIEEINNAVTQPTRIQALLSMRNLIHKSIVAKKRYCNHYLTSNNKLGSNSNNDTSIIMDCWIRAGAANSLCLKLGYVSQQLQNCSFSDEKNGSLFCNEIHELCSLLSMLYGSCSEAELQRSIQQIGVELLPLLFQIVMAKGTTPQVSQYCCYCDFYEKVILEDTSEYASSSLQNTLDPIHRLTLSAFYLVFILTKASCNNAIVKDHIVDLALRRHPTDNSCFLDFNIDQIHSSSSSDNRRYCSISTLSLGIIKNLTFRASLELKVKLARHHGLVDALIHAIKSIIENDTIMPTGNKASSSRRYRKVLGRNAEYASAAIWNILFHRNIITSTTTTTDPQCNNIAIQADMVKVQTDLAADSNLIQTLSDTLLLPSKDDIENDSEDDEVQFIKIRRNAISTIGTLSSVEGNKLRLASNGTLLDSLMVAARLDVDTDVRRRATRTIRYLAQGGNTCATQMAMRYGVRMDLLARLATSDKDSETKNQAIGAFSLVSSSAIMSLLEHQVQHAIALSTIYLISTLGQTLKHIDLCMLALLHLSDVPGNCLWMMDQNEFLDILHFVLTEKSFPLTALEYTVKILCNLSGERINLSRLGRTDKILCTLAELTSLNGANYSIVRHFSVETIVRLSDEESNLSIMAENQAILTSLVLFALESPDGSLLKRRVKEALLKIVPGI